MALGLGLAILTWVVTSMVAPMILRTGITRAPTSATSTRTCVGVGVGLGVGLGLG